MGAAPFKYEVTEVRKPTLIFWKLPCLQRTTWHIDITSGWDLTALNAAFSNALLEDFMIVPLISPSGKNGSKFLLCFCFLTLFIANLLIFSSLYVFLSPLPTYSMPVFLFFSPVFFIFRSLSFLHTSYFPVLSSFKDAFFEFHDLILSLSRIKFIVLGFDLSRFCGSETLSFCTIATDLDSGNSEHYLPPVLLLVHAINQHLP